MKERLIVCWLGLLLSTAGSLQASLQSARAHGIADQDYRNARSIWAQVKTVYKCRETRPVLPEAHRGFDANHFYLPMDTEVVVTMIYDGARARNSLAWYDAADPDTWRIIWRDVSTGPTAPLEQGSKASLGVLPAGSNLRFALREDGARGGLNNLFMDRQYNPGGIEQVAARVFDPGVSGLTIVGFEDRAGGGDQDFNDVIFQVEFRPVSGPKLYQVNTTTGLANLVSQLSLSGAFRTLLPDALSGELMLLDQRGGRVVQINPHTQEMSSHAWTQMGGRRLGRGSYAHERNSLLVYDDRLREIVELSLGSLQHRSVCPIPSGLVVQDLVYDESGSRLLVAMGGAAPALYAVSDLDGAGTLSLIGDLSLSLSGLAWDARNRLLGFHAETGELYEVRLYPWSLQKIGPAIAPGGDGDLASSGQNPRNESEAPFMQLHASGADVITQHDNVVPGVSGVNSNRGGRGLAANLERFEMSGAQHELFHELFYIPHNATELKFELIDDRGSFKFDFGIFDYAVVEGLAPGSLEYAVAAVSNGHCRYENNRVVWADGRSGSPASGRDLIGLSLFDDRWANPGATMTLDVAEAGLAGKVVGFFIIPNNKIQSYLRNPWRYAPKGNGNNTKRQPLFTVSGANPGQLDQAMAFGHDSRTIFTFEDLTRVREGHGWNSDDSFDDMTFAVTPAIRAVGPPTEVYLLEPAAEEIRLRQTTVEMETDWDGVYAALDRLESITLEQRPLLQDAYLSLALLELTSADSTAPIGIELIDPARPHEQLVVWPDAQTPSPVIGLGFYPAGTVLHFRASQGEEENDSREAATVIGKVPGEDVLIVEMNVGSSVLTLGLSATPWDLEYSGDVRNLTEEGDGHAQGGHACY